MTAINLFAAHIGLDWADKKHDVCVQFNNGERVFHVIEHTPEALDSREDLPRASQVVHRYQIIASNDD